MSFTQSTITHSFTNADGSPGSGSLTFALTKRISNSGTSIVPASEIVAQLNGSGHLSQAVTSNSDAGTTPTGSQWRVDIRIAGCSQESYFITVPVGPGTVDLGTLLPETQQIG